MARSKIYVGLEIGTSKVCMLVGEVKKDNSVKILGIGSVKSAGVRKGEICDFSKIRDCVEDARRKAEESSDVEIGSVLLSVTGSHMMGVNSTGTYRLPDRDKQIHAAHLKEAEQIACNIHLTDEQVILHHTPRMYRLDQLDHMTPPIGLYSTTIQSHYHIVYGTETRIKNSIKCVRELNMDVDEVVFAPIASAQYALNAEEKERGVLLIDLGGGTTDYALYLNGAIAASGCVALGGEHVSNDIHMIAEIPFTRAENLKISEGYATGESSRYVSDIKFPVDDSGFTHKDVKRELLNAIIRERMVEILTLVKKRLPEGALEQLGSGVILRGGGSSMKGLNQLVTEVFGVSVNQSSRAEISGVQANFQDPQFTTCLGLIRYAQYADVEKRRKTKFIDVIWPFGRKS
jgi:cell division protein FtsA